MKHLRVLLMDALSDIGDAVTATDDDDWEFFQKKAQNARGLLGMALDEGHDAFGERNRTRGGDDEQG